MPYDQNIQNIGEAAVLNNKGGAVAFFGTARTVYYENVFGLTGSDGPSKLAGVNFWGWGGSAVPKHKSWKQGDPYTGDPAQEDQGLNSVFSADRSTIEIIRRANR